MSSLRLATIPFGSTDATHQQVTVDWEKHVGYVVAVRTSSPPNLDDWQQIWKQVEPTAGAALRKAAEIIDETFKFTEGDIQS